MFAHWQVAGPTFYQLQVLFDKNYDEQVEVVNSIAERIQLLGGVSLATAAATIFSEKHCQQINTCDAGWYHDDFLEAKQNVPDSI